MAVGSGNITIINTSTSATVATIAVGSGLVSVSSNVVTINPASALASSTAFHVLIPATAFDDAATNSYAGISSATALNFATGDSVAPTLTSSAPTDGATGVGLNANIVLTFSEAVDVETGNILIKKTVDDSTFETVTHNGGLVSVSSNVVTINPAGTFASSTGYYLVIPSTFFDDASSNDYAGFSTKTVLNFTSADSVAPTLASSSPADNATGVAEGSNIVLTFSEVVDRESGNITIKKTSDNSTIEAIAVTDSKITGTGTNVITINPTANLASSTEFYVLVDASAFDDTSSNSYAGISSTTALSFTTSDTVSPTLLSSVACRWINWYCS